MPNRFHWFINPRYKILGADERFKPRNTKDNLLKTDLERVTEIRISLSKNTGLSSCVLSDRKAAGNRCGAF